MRGGLHACAGMGWPLHRAGRGMEADRSRAPGADARRFPAAVRTGALVRDRARRLCQRRTRGQRVGADSRRGRDRCRAGAGVGRLQQGRRGAGGRTQPLRSGRCRRWRGDPEHARQPAHPHGHPCRGGYRRVGRAPGINSFGALGDALARVPYAPDAALQAKKHPTEGEGHETEVARRRHPAGPIIGMGLLACAQAGAQETPPGALAPADTPETRLDALQRQINRQSTRIEELRQELGEQTQGLSAAAGRPERGTAGQRARARRHRSGPGAFAGARRGLRATAGGPAGRTGAACRTASNRGPGAGVGLACAGGRADLRAARRAHPGREVRHGTRAPVRLHGQRPRRAGRIHRHPRDPDRTDRRAPRSRPPPRSPR